MFQWLAAKLGYTNASLPLDEKDDVHILETHVTSDMFVTDKNVLVFVDNDRVKKKIIDLVTKYNSDIEKFTDRCDTQTTTSIIESTLLKYKRMTEVAEIPSKVLVFDDCIPFDLTEDLTMMELLHRSPDIHLSVIVFVPMNAKMSNEFVKLIDTLVVSKPKQKHYYMKLPQTLAHQVDHIQRSIRTISDLVFINKDTNEASHFQL